MTGLEKRKFQNFDWSPQNIAILKKLWNEDSMSAERISKEMGGITRNSVIGKAHRLGLKPKKKRVYPRVASILSAKKAKSNFVKPLLSSIPAPVIPMQPLTPPSGALIPFMKINYRTCRSVEGHEMIGIHRMALYCSNPKEPEEAFCPYHQSIYYRQGVC